MQPDAPVSFWKVPEAHGWQPDDPKDSVYVPVGHNVHSSLLAPGAIHVASNPALLALPSDSKTTSMIPVVEV